MSNDGDFCVDGVLVNKTGLMNRSALQKSLSLSHAGKKKPTTAQQSDENMKMARRSMAFIDDMQKMAESDLTSHRRSRRLNTFTREQLKNSSIERIGALFALWGTDFEKSLREDFSHVQRSAS